MSQLIIGILLGCSIGFVTASLLDLAELRAAHREAAWWESQASAYANETRRLRKAGL